MKIGQTPLVPHKESEEVLEEGDGVGSGADSLAASDGIDMAEEVDVRREERFCEYPRTVAAARPSTFGSSAPIQDNPHLFVRLVNPSPPTAPRHERFCPSSHEWTRAA